MAIFHMQISSVSRGAGRRATAAAAYRSGERLRDERTGELFNHTRRRDVSHAEILLPSQFAGEPVAWARNRERLWNTAEHAEKRHNSRVAREYQVTLPVELDGTRRVALARAYAIEIADRYKVAVDLAVHEPPAGGDPRNFHAHLLTTTREVTPTGLGAKAGIDMNLRERRRHGLPDHRQEYLSLRERWATLTNEALREANIDARIDHRSLAVRGIDREPRPSIPLKHLKMEQRGLHSQVAEGLRAQYRERVARRLERQAAREGPEDARRDQQAARSTAVTTVVGTDIEKIRRRAREAWLQLRSNEPRTNAQSSGRDEGSEREAQEQGTATVKSPQDDFAL
jgi:hypothetical protein